MTFDDTKSSMEEAFEAAGYSPPDETPQEAAERIWNECRKTGVNRKKGETLRDPVEVMAKFDEWARESPDRILGVIGERVWSRLLRGFLERDSRVGKSGWKHGGNFFSLLRKKETKEETDGRSKRRDRWNADPLFTDKKLRAESKRRYHRRKRQGVKVVKAEVDIETGKVVNLIDKEYGPFAHIRINGLRLAEVTTEQALHYCDIKDADNRFIRALCQMIPDPRKPIGEQWDADMIIRAKEIAARG